ncbi:hypothetical protein SH661x_004636 [Planctomicrobium sp. SH661]|uniref:hypothetical protein n=1 Tax=Planctomicrobium sp. SH661 TaxID=3448124 RepID=UPI003F5B7632
MKNPKHELADAIRDVTASVQKAIDEGYRSRAIDADDLVEVLLAIADRLDPPIEPPEQNQVAPGLACPECGEADADRLIWLDDEFVQCDACGTIYPSVG